MHSLSGAWCNLTSKDANLQFTDWFTIQTSDYDVFIDFCVESASLATLFKKVQCHHDLIEAHGMR